MQEEKDLLRMRKRRRLLPMLGRLLNDGIRLGGEGKGMGKGLALMVVVVRWTLLGHMQSILSAKISSNILAV